MKQLILITAFVCASAFAFAQYNHVQVGPNGNKLEEGQYNANPDIQPGDSKEIIAKKISTVHKTGTWKYWFDNGQMAAEEHYDNTGNATGIWKSWHNNGQLASEIDKSSGTAIFYHANGKKAEEGKMDNITRVGAWQGWHENGTINYKGSYTNAGQKDGAWSFYDNNGVLTATEKYSNGVKK
ncbi:MAG TPA: hypothetical protein VI731_12010 [Bacteroidia bacterium]|nr:hypothetical protein [Bacteroidia bacterium]